MVAEENPKITQFTHEMVVKDSTKDSTTLEDELDKEMGGTGAAWMHIVTDLADNTGMHGLGNIRRHGSIIKKLFWIVVLLTALGFGVWQITLCVEKLISLPTETTIKEEFSSMQDFPAITFCNINPMRYSALASLSGFSSYQSQPEANESAPMNFTDWNNDASFAEDTSYLQEADFLFKYATLPATQRQAVGHQLESMLMSCSYKGRYCAPSNFSTFLNSQYGNCFTFNNGYNGTAIQPMKKSGPNNALQITLFIEQSEYVKAAAKSAGLRVVIHSPDHMPFPEDEGFGVRPGTETYVAIKQVDNHLTEPPYGPCQETTPEENLEKNAYANFDAGRPIAYSAKVCKNTCLQKALISTCNCSDAAYPNSGPAFASLGTNYTICDIQDSDVDWCTYYVYDDYASGKLDCETDCPPACHDVSYTRDISQILWPSEVNEADVMNQMYSLSESLYNLNSAMTLAEQASFLKKNVLKIRIFFSTLEKTIITTSPSYQVFQFLSDLGGQCGLWLGFSVMTFFEFIELFYDIIVLCITSAKSARRNMVDAS